MSIDEVRTEKTLKFISIFAIAFCGILLFPQVQNFIIQITGKVLGRDLRNYGKWMKIILECSLFAILCFGSILMSSIQKLQNFLEKYGEKIVIYASISVVAISIIVRVIMSIKSPPLWGDEAELAASIVSRNWFELAVPPLSFNQSAPVLYVFLEKTIGSLIGYSEFSLRLFSLLSFLGLLICEMIFLKKIFNFDRYKISFVVIMSALLPTYIWYSNELKPYMSDAFFVFLTILLYFYYINEKIKLPILTILCILLFGFSTPVIFFTGGMLFSEFLFAVFSKNKKQILYIVMAGIAVIAVFSLYYYWWHLPVSKFMLTWWSYWYNDRGIIIVLASLFSSYNSASTYVWVFVPFAILGFYSLIIRKNKIAYMVVLSLFFTFFASAIGKWPLSCRLWLFLPAIVFIFTPIGFDFIHGKIKSREWGYMATMEFLISSIIVVYLSINCLTFFGDKMYLEDVNSLVSYVQENIKEDEKLYVHRWRKAQVQFKIGYSTTKIGNVKADNIIYLDEYTQDFGNELLSIIENEKVYLILPSYGGTTDVLRNYGTLTEVMNVHNIPLYYFEIESQ